MPAPPLTQLTEVLRKDPLTWFWYLPQDVTQLIGQLVRPIDRTVLWRKQQEMTGPVVLLEDGTVSQTIVKRRPYPLPDYSETNYFTLPDFQPAPPTESRPVNSTSVIIAGEEVTYSLVSSGIGNCLNLTWSNSADPIHEQYVFVLTCPDWFAKLPKPKYQMVPRSSASPSDLLHRSKSPRHVSLASSGILYIIYSHQIYCIDVLNLSNNPTLTLIYEGDFNMLIQTVTNGLVIVSPDHSVVFYDQTKKQITRRFALPGVTAVVPDLAANTFYLQVKTDLYGVTDTDEVVLKTCYLPRSSVLTITPDGYLLVVSPTRSCVYY